MVLKKEWGNIGEIQKQSDNKEEFI